MHPVEPIATDVLAATQQLECQVPSCCVAAKTSVENHKEYEVRCVAPELTPAHFQHQFQYFMVYTAEEWLQIGLEKYENGLYEQAISAFDHAFSPNESESIIKSNHANSDYRKKEATIDYDKAALLNAHNAIDLLNKSILLDSTNAGAYYFRGEIKLTLNDNHGAIEDLNRSIQIDPNNADVYSARGFCNDQNGDKKAAFLDFTKAIQIDSKNAYSYYQRGLIKSEWETQEDAISDFNQVIMINPNIAEAYSSRGLAKSKLGRFKEAIIDFNQAILIDPKYADAYSNRGLTKAHLGNKEEAIVDYDEAIVLDPSDANTYLNRSLAYKSLSSLYFAQLDANCFLLLTDHDAFFRATEIVFEFYHSHPAPYLLYRHLEKFTNNFAQFNTIHPIIDATLQQCRPWKTWEEYRRLTGSKNQEPLLHYHALALVNYYMGDSIEAFRIYDEVLDDEKAMGVPLNLMGLYYYIESAKLFRQEYEVILEDAYLLYFYISYVDTSEDTGVGGEANSAAVKKVVELLLAPISFTGKILTAATGGAVARLFKLFLSKQKDQINMQEFQNSRISPEPPDDFKVFCENFLRFISFQRETLGEKAFEEQYPLAGFDDRSQKRS